MVRITACLALLAPLAAACAGAPQTLAPPLEPAARVMAVAETTPVESADDAADDPAIWIHPTDPLASLILGTDKQAGLGVYALNGTLRQFLPVGPVNNVDVRQGVRLGATRADVAVASHRGVNAVSVFTIDANGGVREDLRIPTNKIEPYGICMGFGPAGDGAIVYVTYKDGGVQRFALSSADAGEAGANPLTHTYAFDSQLEGCVVDEAAGVVYIGEENAGLWRLHVDADGTETGRVLVDPVGSPSGLRADIEGVALYRPSEDPAEGYIVASSQGADRFVVYARGFRGPDAPNAVLGDFAVDFMTNAGLDPVTETDGLAVSAASFGPGLPGGLVVVQDDVNSAPDAPQNFKIIAWDAVAKALELD